jgi:Putative peptidoglycan binding domain
MAAIRKSNDLWSMKKITLLSLVGITSIALTHAGWAAGRGGGGGFHGGGFGGGHFGGGARGGGFGGARHFSGGSMSFGRGAPRFSGRAGTFRTTPRSFAQPNYRMTNRPASSNIARNRAATPSVARQSRTFSQRGLNGRTDHVFARHEANWHSDWDRRHAHFDHGHFFVFDDGLWFGLDDGFFPWDYLPYYADDYYPYDYYTDDQGNDDSAAAYDNTPVADSTVQSVQTRLSQLGYYNGPADGIFGPTTRDAVAKYQIATQLNVTGSLSPDTLQSLSLQATSS